MAKSKAEKTLSPQAKKALTKYVSLVEKLGRYPSIVEMGKAGLTRDTYRHHFLNTEGLREAAKKFRPDVFESLFSSDSFTAARLKDTKRSLRDVEEFIITTVAAGCTVNEAALAAVDTWMQDSGGKLICQPIKDPASTTGGSLTADFFDPALEAYDFDWSGMSLNNKVHISSILMSAKQLNPHTGLERISDNSGLTIVASPKRRLTPLANMEGQPGYLISAGAITEANYFTERYMSQRTAAFGYAEHKLGGVYVKLLGKNRFEFTPIEFDEKDGHFCVGLQQYEADGTIYEIKPQIITFGDLHIEELSKWRLAEFYRILSDETPDEIDLHDVYCGISCSPFNKRKPELQYLESREYKTQTVQQDLKWVGEVLNTAASMTGKVNIVDSNHHKFLEYWITSGAYRVGNPADIKFAHELAHRWLDAPEVPILQTALMVAGVKLKTNVTFWNSTKSIKFKGVERSQHGHCQSGGRPKGDAKYGEELGPCNIGHTHRTWIVGDAYGVGTFSGIADHRPAYAKNGPNKWSNSYIRTYPCGQREIVHVFEPA